MIEDYEKLFKIDSGGSPVKKTILKKDDEKYILRKYNPKFMDDRLKAFEIRNSITNVNMPNIIEEGPNYAIFEYVDGNVLEKVVESNIDLFARLSALELKKLHACIQNECNIDEEYLKSINSRLSKITCLEDNEINLIKSYIKDNIYILKGRRKTVIHGDFHPGNVIISNKGLYLIDLDMLSYGEKYIDLVNIFGNYPEFYNKLYEYYFDGKPNEEFYVINNLYSILLGLDYINYSKREFNNELKGKKVFDDYLKSTNNLTLKKPAWIR